MCPVPASPPLSAPQRCKPRVINCSTFCPALCATLQSWCSTCWPVRPGLSRAASSPPGPPVPAPAAHSLHLGGCSEQGLEVPRPGGVRCSFWLLSAIAAGVAASVLLSVSVQRAAPTSYLKVCSLRVGACVTPNSLLGAVKEPLASSTVWQRAGPHGAFLASTLPCVWQLLGTPPRDVGDLPGGVCSPGALGCRDGNNNSWSGLRCVSLRGGERCLHSCEFCIW